MLHIVSNVYTKEKSGGFYAFTALKWNWKFLTGIMGFWRQERRDTTFINADISLFDPLLQF